NSTAIRFLHKELHHNTSNFICINITNGFWKTRCLLQKQCQKVIQYYLFCWSSEGSTRQRNFNMNETSLSYQGKQRIAKITGSVRSPQMWKQSLDQQIAFCPTISPGSRFQPSHIIIGGLIKVPADIQVLQPLDVGVFRSFKAYYGKQLNQRLEELLKQQSKASISQIEAKIKKIHSRKPELTLDINFLQNTVVVYIL
ncbi:MAG: hypothetical protein EZS28_005530, partial [Streblomastix strix]